MLPVRPPTRAVICLSLLLTYLLVVVPGLHADVREPSSAPIIDIEVLSPVTADQRQVFTARVVDDSGVGKVTLFFRRAGNESFSFVGMRRLGNSDFFSASIRTRPSDLRPMQYFIRAEDRDGNAAASGFAFDPYQRVLQPASGLALRPPDMAADGLTETRSTVSDTPAQRSSTRRNWWAVALGVVAVGAIASLAQSGGDDGDNAGDTQSPVPLTVNLGRPR